MRMVDGQLLKGMAGREPFECRKHVSSGFVTLKCWNCGRRVLIITVVVYGESGLHILQVRVKLHFLG